MYCICTYCVPYSDNTYSIFLFLLIRYIILYELYVYIHIGMCISCISKGVTYIPLYTKPMLSYIIIY